MRYRVLGQTGIFVSELCLGTMTFGASSGKYAAASGVDQNAANVLVRKAIDAGVNFIDTANVYANGQAEEIVGRALKTLGVARKDVVLATKAEHAIGTGPNDGGASRVHLIEQVKASLKRLGTDYIDLYQLHGWDPATSLDETLRALDDLVRQGYVRSVGVANWAAWQVTKALGAADRLRTIPIHATQNYYSLVGRELERELLPMAKNTNLALLIFSPLAGGYLSGKYRQGSSGGRRNTIPFPPVDGDRGERVLVAMETIASRRGMSMVALAIAWLLNRPAVTSVIMGVKNVEQLDENLKATEVTLSVDDSQALDEASALPAEYPGWMFATADAPRQALLETGVLGE